MPVSKTGKLIGNISVHLAIILLSVVAFLFAALAGYFFDKDLTVWGTDLTAFWLFAILSIVTGTFATYLSEIYLEKRIDEKVAEKIKETESYLKGLMEYQKKGRQAV